MQELKDIAWNVSEPEYRQDKALSYSTIARYSREGFKGLKSLFDPIETSSTIFGSLVDTLLTEPQKFKELFIISNTPLISESLEDIANKLATLEYKSFEEIPDSTLAQVGEDMGYYANSKYKNYRIKQIKENCKPLFDFIRQANGRKVIKKTDYDDAMECARELKSNPYTARFFEPDNPFDDSIKKYYQLKFKGEYEGIQLRGMMDLVIVDTKNKKIIPIDLKTSFKPEYQFYDSYLQWCYNIQSNLYTYLIRQNLDKYEEFKDYTISDYLFVVISRGTKKPMVWRDNTNRSEVQTILKSGVTLPYWRELVVELNNYLSQDRIPDYPSWVENYNNIYDHLH